MTMLESIKSQIFKIAGLITFFATAVAGESGMVQEPWNHRLTVVAFMCSTLIAWNIKQHPVKEVEKIA